ncbi:PKD domain-containing protein [Pontibacter beigongshangensis]|uniref:PKD domain-containing protein n=1 Tax=Pontibacter beigongshangensis TaxID=2574733 RepID=UPI0016504384|nr:PKD domain-containing protein [Pontibacter beigongshangensis]
MARLLRLLYLLPLFLYSSTAIAQWVEQLSPTSNALQSVQMIDEQVFFLGGSDGIYQTTNGGLNWQRFKLQKNTQDSVYIETMGYKTIHFLDANIGFAAGWTLFGHNIILKTIDRGVNWRVVYLSAPTGNIFNLGFRTITFVNKQVGYVAGARGNVFKTTDGGENWHSVSVPMPDNEIAGSVFNSIFFTSATSGYVAGSGLYKTSNGGLSWQKIVATGSTPLAEIHDLYFFDELNGFAAANVSGDGNYIFKTTNGGQSWKQVMQPNLPGWANKTNGQINDIHFLNRQEGMAVGNYLTWKTTDGGETWESLQQPVNADLRAAYFLNATNGIAVDNNGKIYTTSNLGGAVKPLAGFDLPATSSYCPDTSFTFINKGPSHYTYKWYLNNELLATSYHLTTTFEEDTLYDIKLIAEHKGQTSSVTQSIRTAKTPALRPIIITASNTFFCDQNTNLIISVSDPDPWPTKYQLWSNGQLIETASQSSGYNLRFKGFIPKKSATYTVTAIRADACGTIEATPASVSIEVAPTPKLDNKVEALREFYCAHDLGLDPLIRISDSDPDFYYSTSEAHGMYLGNGGDLTIPAYSQKQLEVEGGYYKEFTVTVRHKNCPGGLPKYTLQNKAIYRFSYLTLAYEVSKPTVFLNEPLVISNTTIAASYKWSVEDNGTRTVYHTKALPDVRFSTTGEKTVMLTATSAAGCVDSTKFTVRVVKQATLQQEEICAANEPETIVSESTLNGRTVLSSHTDTFGNTYITGYRNIRGGSNTYFFLEKYTLSGKLLWSKIHSGTLRSSYSFGTGITTDQEGNVYLCGNYMSSSFSSQIDEVVLPRTTHYIDSQAAFILKFTAEGKAVWATVANSSHYSSALASSITIDQNQHIYAAIHSNMNVTVTYPDGTSLTNPLNEYGAYYSYLLKVDTNGTSLGAVKLSHYQGHIDVPYGNYSINGLNSVNQSFTLSPQLQVGLDNKMYVEGMFYSHAPHKYTVGSYVLTEDDFEGQKGYIAIVDLDQMRITKAFGTYKNYLADASEYLGYWNYSDRGFSRLKRSIAVDGNSIYLSANWDWRPYNEHANDNFQKAPIMTIGDKSISNSWYGALITKYDHEGNVQWTNLLHNSLVPNLYFSREQNSLFAYTQFENVSGISSMTSKQTYGVAAANTKSQGILKYTPEGELVWAWQQAVKAGKTEAEVMAASGCDRLVLFSKNHLSTSNGYTSQILPLSLTGNCTSVTLTVSDTFTATTKEAALDVSFKFPEIQSSSPYTATWDFGDGTTTQSLKDVVSHTFSVAGTYQVRVTISNGCIQKQLWQQVQVPCQPEELDSATITYQITGNLVQLKANGVQENYVTRWTFSDGSSSTEKEPAFSFHTPGTTTATLWLENSCNSKTATADIVLTLTSLEATSASELLTVYPSPAATELFVAIDKASPVTINAIEIYDSLGRILISLKAKDISEKTLLNVSSLSTGMYYVRANLKDGNSLLKKFIIQK